MTPREIDAMVAVKVMDWVVNPSMSKDGILIGVPPEDAIKAVGGAIVRAHEVPHYSTRIGAAWDVVEHFVSAGTAAGCDGDGHTGYAAFVVSVYQKYEARSRESAAMAICKAALKSRGIEIEEKD